MPVYDVFGERRQEKVMRDTWGHLAAEPGQTYYGEVTFAHAAFGGDTAFLSMEFKTKSGVPLQGNPWSHEHITEYITQWICDQANGYRDRKPIPYSQRIECDGKVITFIGSYTCFKNGSCRIAGRFQERTVI